MTAFEEGASRMPGASPAYNRLIYFIAKYANLRVLLEQQGETELSRTSQRLIRTYSRQAIRNRDPTQLPDEVKNWLADYSMSWGYTEAVARAFGNWYDLQRATRQVPELRWLCDPRSVDSFPQLIDRVCQALGFFEEESPEGLVQAQTNVKVDLECLQAPDVNLRREVPRVSVTTFETFERILKDLISFYCRALDFLGERYREKLLERLRSARDSTYSNYRYERMQLGNYIPLLEQLNLYINDEDAPDRQKEFEEKFGLVRKDVIDLGEWKPILSQIASIRAALIHPSLTIRPDEWEEIVRLVEGPEKGLFHDRQLHWHRNERGEWVIHFTLHQRKVLLVLALTSLQAFYTYLGEGIYPEVQIHDRLEIGRDGQARLFYKDEYGILRYMLLDRDVDSRKAFFPGQRVFFCRFYADGRPFWCPARE